MRRGNPVKSRCLLVFATIIVALSAASCGDAQGEEEAASSPVEEQGSGAPEGAAFAENAEVGKTLAAQGWTISLIDRPEQAKQVGSGAADAMTNEGSSFGGLSGVREADGVWLILVVEIVNGTGDMAFIPKSLLAVTDDQGGHYEAGGVREAVGPLINDDDRWESQEENQLVQWVFEEALPRRGPLVFDVPEQATGLKLVIEGTDETIDLGF